MKINKWLLVPFVFCILFFISDRSNAKDEYGMLLSETELLAELDLEHEKDLAQMVLLPETPYNEEEAKGIIERLDLLPASILHKSRQANIKIVLFAGRLTDYSDTLHLQGVVPRGYPNTIIWDQVPGMGGTKYVFVKIGSSAKGAGHGSVNLEYHELAHSLYNYLYDDSKTATAFTRLWEIEAEKMFPGQDYFIHFKEEYFAETFAFYYFSSITRDELKSHAPGTYDFFAELK